MSKLEGQTIAVTGASAGVGRAIAIAFGRQGCKVALIARGESNLHEAALDVEAAGGQALVVPCDVADAAALAAAADRIEHELGPIAIWVNNAMVTVYAPVSELLPEEIAQVTNVTYLGQVFGAQAVLTHMRRRKHGTIIFINSALGYRSIPFQAPYCAAKAAVRGFVDSLRSELRWGGCKNIKLTTIYLPAVNTPQFGWARNKLKYAARPVAPIYQPEIIAKAVVQAALDRPRELWLGTSTLKAIIGQLVAPGFVDRLLAFKGPTPETDKRLPPQSGHGNLFVAGTAQASTRGCFDEQVDHDLAIYEPARLRVGVISATLLIVAGAILHGIQALSKEARSSATPIRLSKKSAIPPARR